MKLNPIRKLLEEVYVMGYGKGVIVEHRVACTKFPPLYKVRLRDGTVIAQVQERDFGVGPRVQAAPSIPRLVKG